VRGDLTKRGGAPEIAEQIQNCLPYVRRLLGVASDVIYTLAEQSVEQTSGIGRIRLIQAKLIEKRESERMAQMQEIKGEMKKIEWGSQIRSYVFHPYTMVKDHRTGVEVGNVSAVMDGDIDAFINAYLIMS